jgi:hypothetical protein
MPKSKRVKEATKVMLRSLVPSWCGCLTVIAITVVGAEPTWKTWVGWACLLVGLPAFMFVITYVTSSKRD